MLALKLIVQLPPKPLRFPRPQQNPESTMVALRAGPPFIVDAAEPGEMFEKLIAKRGFQPGEILPLRRPFARAPQMGATRVTQPFPTGLAMANLDATADKFTAFAGQRQMTAGLQCCGFAKRTILLPNHGYRRRLTSKLHLIARELQKQT